MHKFLIPSAALVLMPQMALAHAGHFHDAPFLTGVLHPLGGTDHLLAMIAVGLWAAVTGGRAIWALPFAFLAAMLGGGAFGAMGYGLPAVEPMILVSVVLTGIAAALSWRAPLGVCMVVVAAFGLFHGHAHGTEGPVAGVMAYAAGFALSTMALHAAGLAAGLGLGALQAHSTTRTLGAGTAMAGLALAFT